MTAARDRESLFSVINRFFSQGEKQLWFEMEQPFLRGAAADISAIKKLDTSIGKLLKRFNGVSRIPEKEVAKIEAAVENLYPVFRKVSAWKPYNKNLIEMTIGKAEVTEKPVYYLEYNNFYPSNNGNEIEQRLAKIRLG